MLNKTIPAAFRFYCQSTMIGFALIFVTIFSYAQCPTEIRLISNGDVVSPPLTNNFSREICDQADDLLIEFVISVASTQSYTINWGDGSSQIIVASGSSTKISHVYAEGNDYFIQISPGTIVGSNCLSGNLKIARRSFVSPQLNNVINGFACPDGANQFQLDLDLNHPRLSPNDQYTIDWGDGSSDLVESINFNAEQGSTPFNHTYTGVFPGDVYTVIVSGANNFLNTCAPIIIPASSDIIFQEEPEPEFTFTGNVCENGGLITLERTTEFDFPTSEGTYQWEIINVTDGNTIFTFPFEETVTTDPNFTGSKQSFDYIIEDGDIDFSDEVVVKLTERNSCSPGVAMEQNIQINAVPATSINTVDGIVPGADPISICLQDLEIVLNNFDPAFSYAWTLVNGHGIFDPPTSITNDFSSNPLIIPANQLTTGDRTLFISTIDNSSGQSCESVFSVELVVRDNITPTFTIDDDLDDDGITDDNCGAIAFDIVVSESGLKVGDIIKIQFSKKANFSDIENAETVNLTFNGSLSPIDKTLPYFGSGDEAIWYIRSTVENLEGCEFNSLIEPLIIKEQPKKLNLSVTLVNKNSPTDDHKNFIFCDGDRVNVQAYGGSSSNSIYNWTLPAGAILDDATPNNSAIIFFVSEATDGGIIEVEEVLNGCTFTTQSDPITVNKVPTGISIVATDTGIEDGEVCFDGDGSVTFNVADALGDVTVNFNVNGVNANLTGTSPLVYGDDPTESLLQNLTSDANVLITSANTNSGCAIPITGANATLKVLEPVYNLSLDKTTVCSNESVNLKVNINGGTGPYNLTISNDKGLPDISLSGYNSGANIPLTLPNLAEDITYQITTINDNSTGCSPSAGSNPTISLTVLEIPPQPTVTTSHVDEVCLGTDVTLISDLIISDATYRWVDNTGGIVQENVSPELIRSAVQDENYRVKVIAPGGCASNFSTPVNVQINALPDKPVVSVADGAAEFCDDNITSVTLTASDIQPGEGYRWLKDGNDITETTADLILNDITESGDYTVQVIGNGATACKSPLSDALAVTIKEIPGAPVLSGETTLCAGPGKEFYFVAPVTGATYNWSLPAAANQVLGGAPADPFVQLVFPDAGNYPIEVALTVNGCTGPKTTLAVEVLNPTATSAITGKDIICEDDLETFNVTNTPGSTYQWSVPSGSFITSGGNSNQITVSFGSGTAAGANPQITVTETNLAGCASTPVVKNITVNNLPTANIVGNTTTICEGNEFDMEVAWTGALPLTINYLIDGSLSGNFTVPTGTSGNYFHDFEPDPSVTTIYTLTSVADNNGCASNATGLIRVNVDPIPELELGPNQSIPQGGDLTIIPVTLEGTFNNIEWSASPSSAGSFDNDNSENPTFTPNPAFTGAVTISATISDPGPCEDVSDSFILNVNPAGAIVAGNDIIICENSGAISFLDAVRDIDNKYDQYTWSSAPAGSFSITTINNPTSDDDLHTEFTPTSGTGTYTITLSAVDFNDGLPNASATFLLVINKLPTATLITTSEQIICEGAEADISVQLTGSSANPEWTLIWEDDQGTTGTATADASPFTFAVPGTTGATRTYRIQSVTENGSAVCTNTNTSGSVKVSKRVLPIAEIITDDYAVCAGEPMGITITLTGSGPWNVKWSADGGATENIIASIISSPHTFSMSPPVGTATNFILTEVTEQNGTTCSGTIQGDGVTITNNPLPTVVLSGNTTICESQSTDLKFEFTGRAPWNVVFNDGTSDIKIDNIAASPHIETISPAANTTYTLVEVSDGNGCLRDGLTQSVVVQVNPIPTVDAGPDRSVPVNTVINLVPNLSGSFTSVKWDDGGAGGNFTNPNTANTSYTPPAGFVGDITLTLNLGDGGGPCADDISDQLIVTYNAAGSVVAGPNQEVCDGGAVTLAGAELAADYERYIWSADRPGTFTPATIDDPATADALHTDFFPSNGPGTYVVTLTVVDLDGVLPDATGSLTVTVNPLPTVSISGATTICESQSTDLTFDFTGTAPWSVIYNDGTSDITIDNIGASPHTETVTPAANTTYTLVEVNDGNGCARDGLTQSVVVQVNPIPTVDAGPDRSVPVNTVVNLVPGLSGSFTSVQWDDGGAGGAFANPNTANTSYTPPAGFVGDITLTLTLGDGSGPCADDISDQLVVTYNAAGSVVAGPNQEVCDGGTVTLAGAELAADYERYIWSADRPGTFTPASIDDPATADALHTDFFPSNGPGIYVVTLTVVDLDGVLPDATGSLSVTVNPLPTVSISGAATICESQSTDLTFDFTGTAPWSVVYNDGTSDIKIDNIAASPYSETVTPAANTTYTLVEVSDGNGCLRDGLTQSVVVQVNPIPTVDAGPDRSVPVNTVINLVPNLSGSFTSVQWDDGGVGGNFANPNTANTSYTPPAGFVGDITLTLTLGDGGGPCADDISDQLVVTYNAAGSVIAGANQEVCEGGSINLEEALLVPGYNRYLWSTDRPGSFAPAVIDDPSADADLATIFTPSNGPGDYLVTLTAIDADGILPDAKGALTVKVNPMPIVAIAGATTICEGQSTYLTFNLSGTAPWSVTFNDGVSNFTIDDISNSPHLQEVSPLTTTTYTLVSVKDANGCERTGLTQSVVIQVNPLVQVNPEVTAELCSGEPIQIDGNPLGGSGIYDKHLWQGSGTSFLSDPAIPDPVFQTNVDQPTTFELTYQVTDRNTCITTSQPLSFTVYPKPVINFAEKQLELCAGEVLILNPKASGGDGNYTHQWTGNGSILLSDTEVEQPEFIAVVDQTTSFNLTYSLKDGNSCQVTDQLKIIVLPAVVIEPIADQELCQAERIQLAAKVSGEYSSLLWSSDQKGEFSAADELNTFFTPEPTVFGDIAINLIATSQGAVCSESSTSFIINVKEKIEVDAGLNLAACENEPVQIDAIVSGNYGSLQWNTSGEGVLINPDQDQVIYQPETTETGVITFQLTASDESGLCPAVEDEVTVNFNPAPVFDLQAAPFWCEEDQVLIEGKVSGTFSDLTWTTSGNGRFSNPKTASTTYFPAEGEVGEVVLTLNTKDESGSCPEFSDWIDINLVPKPKVNAGSNLTINEGEIANLRANVSGTYDRTEWTTSGNGTFFGNEMSVIYTPADGEEGEIVLTLIAYDDSNLCSSASDQLILSIIPRQPTARFSASVISGCVPLEVQFSNESFDAENYEWDFGDNSNQVFTTDATHIYKLPGTYTASLTALNAAGRQDQFTVSIQVYSLPIASFSVNPLEYFMPDPLNLVNASQGATTYLWDFGDGNTSTEFEPAYGYSEPGTYEISLQVENEAGCADEYFFEEPVVIKEGGTIVIPDAFTPSIAGPAEGRVVDVNANDVFLPVTTGVQDFQMIIFNRWGQQVFTSNDAEIGWNGFIGAELAPSGTYIYQVQIQFSDGTVINKTGNVTLIR